MAKAGRFGAMMAGCLLVVASASPAAAGTILDTPARSTTAADMMAGKSADAAEAHAATPFDAAIGGYHATTAWMGIPERDVAAFLVAFLKGSALLALVYAISQRRLFTGGTTRRS